ncbi:MAG: HAD-IA family hydrolase [Dethiosulfatibacter sp.]|nr:HAD-IA family hydrolase [Dethiosulfatibacter sp.]
MIKNIVFDLDGTLADSEELILKSFQHIYKTFKGHEVSESHIKKTFGEILEKVIKSEFDEDYQIVVSEYREFHYENFDKYMKLYDGAKEIIEELYLNNYTLGIVTSRLGLTAMKILEMYNITKYFKSIITADMCVNHKPHPDPLLKCLNDLGGTKEETIFIGDTVFDLECARNAGITSVLVSWSNLDTSLLAVKPDFVINQYDDIKNIISSIK